MSPTSVLLKAPLEPVQEDSELGKDLPPRWEHGPNREISRRCTVDWYRYKTPVRHLVLDIPRRKLGQAETRETSRQEPVDTVRREAAAHPHRAFLPVNDELPVGEVRECQAFMVCKVLDCPRCSLPLKIARRRINVLRIVRQSACDQSGILQRRDPDRYVDSGGDDIDDGIVKVELDRKARVLLEQFVNDRHDPLSAQCDGCSDPEQPRGPALYRTERRLRRFLRIHDRPCKRQEGLAFGRE